jgi:hypothetical protein
MVTRDDIRDLALQLPEAEEAGHHGIPSFRVGGKIFSTIHLDHPRMMAKLGPEDQHNLSAAHPGVVEPVPGYWGRKGSTFVFFERADAALIKLVLDLAWRNVVPRRLAGEQRRGP